MQLVLFDLGALAPETRSVVEREDGEFTRNMEAAGAAFILACRNVLHIHEALRYKRPGFVDWCNSKRGFSDETGRKMLRVAQMFQDSGNIPPIESREALYLLAAPSTPEPAREEALARAEAGEEITRTAAKEIVERHRQDDGPASPPLMRPPEPEEEPDVWKRDADLIRERVEREAEPEEPEEDEDEDEEEEPPPPRSPAPRSPSPPPEPSPQEKARHAAEARGIWFGRVSEALGLISQWIGGRNDDFLAWYTRPGEPGADSHTLTVEQIDRAIEQLRRVRDITLKETH
jgi:hypothetical protein